MGRWVCVDYGSRRIGIAISDPGAAIGSPATTLSGTGSLARDAELVLDWARANEAAGLVVGLPLNMDGSDSEQTTLTRRFAEELRRLAPVSGPRGGRGSSADRTAETIAPGSTAKPPEDAGLPVELWDERLSSFQADELMESAGVRRSKRRAFRDAFAAQHILQSFLDARRD